MSPATRDRLYLWCAFALLIVGAGAWWLVAPDDSRFGFGAGGGSLVALWLAAVGLAAASWRVWTQPPSDETRVLAPLALAAVAPLAAVPLASAADPAFVVLGLAGAALAALPLPLASTRWIGGEERARRIWILATACVVAAVIVSLVAASPRPSFLVVAIRWLLLAVAILLPTGLAAVSIRRQRRQSIRSQLRLVTALGLCAAGITPVVTGMVLVASSWRMTLVPIVAVVVTAAVLGRTVVGPLARLAGTAVSQRDLVVAAAEAERVRLASALHDGPLGDISLLVQRFDAAGDAEGATIARSIAVELRAIGSDMRLPILDDLGAGPALEWLASRVGQRGGAAVQLDLQTIARPPAAVELVVYRVAQEALVNAIKHGQPPVQARYLADHDTASLSVDDAGPGLDQEATRRAQLEGRLGLVSMSQRAEAIGAELVLATRAGGGTHVGMLWKHVPA